MRVSTPRDVIPRAGRHGLRQPARPAPAALGVPAHAGRARSALRARRHPARAAHQRVALSASAHAASRASAERPTLLKRRLLTWVDAANSLASVLPRQSHSPDLRPNNSAEAESSVCRSDAADQEVDDAFGGPLVPHTRRRHAWVEHFVDAAAPLVLLA